MKLKLDSYEKGKKITEIVDVADIASIKVFNNEQNTLIFINNQQCKNYYNQEINNISINILLEIFEVNNIQFDVVYQNIQFPLNYYTIEDFFHRNINFEAIGIDDDYDDYEIPYIIFEYFNLIILISEKNNKQ